MTGTLPLPLHALIEDYLADRLLRREIVESSAGVIRCVLRQWARWTLDDDPDDWSEATVLGWVYEQHLRANSSKSRLTKLSPFTAWLADRGHLRVDPCKHIGPVFTPDGDPRDLGLDDARRLLSFVPDLRGVVIVLLMLHIGLRCGDVARIRIEDIDRRRRSLHVRAKNGRGEYTHWTPIPTEAWEQLERILVEHAALGRHGGPLIRSYTTGRGLLPASVGRLVADWLTEAGIKRFPFDGCSAHSLRHTCAQHLIDDGAELRIVQKALGHKTIRSTEIYVRREPAGLREAMDRRRYLRVPTRKEAA